MKTTNEGADRIGIHRGADGRLFVTMNDRTTAVTVTRCFPWAHPERLLSLRDEDDREVALIEDATKLDSASRTALSSALHDVGFLIEVTAIESVDEEFELRVWTVATPHGRRLLQTRRDEWPRRVESGAFVIRDLSGDLYVIRDAGRLDARSRLRLSCYVD